MISKQVNVLSLTIVSPVRSSQTRLDYEAEVSCRLS